MCWGSQGKEGILDLDNISELVVKKRLVNVRDELVLFVYRLIEANITAITYIF